MRFYWVIKKIFGFLYQSREAILTGLKNLPRIALFGLTFSSVTVCENDAPVKDFVFLEKQSRKFYSSVTSELQLRRKLKTAGFNNGEIGKVVKNLSGVLGQEWFDSSAKIEVLFADNGGKFFITKVNFRGVGKNIKINYESSLTSKIENAKIKENFSIMRGFVSSNFEKLILNNREIPFKLRKNIMKFANEGRLKSHRGDRFYCLYDPKTYNVIGVFLGHNPRKDLVLLFHGKSGRKLYNMQGEAIRGEKITFRRPVGGRISGRFGYRIHPILKIYRFHWGVDFANPSGTAIKAPADGVVQFIGNKGGYGRTVILKHDNGINTLYGHLRRAKKNMHIGKRVKVGEPIAEVGMTGLASGPHLHYEIWIRGIKVDPLKFMQERKQQLKGEELKMFKTYARRILRYFE